METQINDGPLSVEEFDQLGRFLTHVRIRTALSLEGMDGLFCALIAGPRVGDTERVSAAAMGWPLPDELVTFNVAM